MTPAYDFYEAFLNDLHNPAAKENAYKRLALQAFPYLEDYNTENPPPLKLKEADELEYQYNQKKSYVSIWRWAVGAGGLLLTFIEALINKTVGFMFVSIIGFVVAFIMNDKIDKDIPDRAKSLRRNLTMTTLANSQTYTCFGVRFRVTITYEISSNNGDLVSENTPLLTALNQKLALVIQGFFEAFEARFRNDNPDVATKQLQNTIQLQKLFEGMILQRVCEICHDFRPGVFRYHVTVHIHKAESSGAIYV